MVFSKKYRGDAAAPPARYFYLTSSSLHMSLFCALATPPFPPKSLRRPPQDPAGPSGMQQKQILQKFKIEIGIWAMCCLFLISQLSFLCWFFKRIILMDFCKNWSQYCFCERGTPWTSFDFWKGKIFLLPKGYVYEYLSIMGQNLAMSTMAPYEFLWKIRKNIAFSKLVSLCIFLKNRS